MRLKATITGSTALILLSIPALAADPVPLPAVAPAVIEAPMAPAPAFSWSGAYLGLFVGYGWGTWDGRHVYLPDPDNTDLGLWDPPEHSFPVSGFLGGATFGVNSQRGPLVIGMEGDYAFTGLNWETSKHTTGDYFWETMHELDHLTTARVRLGFAVGERALLYGTVGLAVARVQSAITAYDTVNDLAVETATGESLNWHVGFAGGVGGEIALGQSISIKAEWLHLGFKEEPYHYIGTETISGDPYFTDATPSSLTLNVFRVGLNFRF